MARNRVSKSCLMPELCFHHFVQFHCVPTYIFGFHHRQYASNQKDFTFVKFTSQLFSSANETLKDKTHLHITSVVKLVHIFMVRNRISKTCLMAKFCFHCFVHFDGIPIYISGFHHKQCACDKKDFTVMKFSSQLCNSADESLKDKTHLLLH